MCLAEFITPLRAAIDELENLTQSLLQSAQQDANAISAAAVDYLQVMGLVLSAWLWARTAAIAALKIVHASDSDGFYQAKLHTARFFVQRCLPQIYAGGAAIRAGSAGLQALADEQFAY
jgi:hypothetical protein